MQSTSNDVEQAMTYINHTKKSHFLQKRAFGVIPTTVCSRTLKCTRRLEPLDLHAVKRKGKRDETDAPLQSYGEASRAALTLGGVLRIQRVAHHLRSSAAGKKDDIYRNAGRRRTVQFKAEP